VAPTPPIKKVQLHHKPGTAGTTAIAVDGPKPYDTRKPCTNTNVLQDDSPHNAFTLSANCQVLTARHMSRPSSPLPSTAYIGPAAQLLSTPQGAAAHAHLLTHSRQHCCNNRTVPEQSPVSARQMKCSPPSHTCACGACVLPTPVVQS
jgi:hypothetical protein